jgi:site-specific DNA-methyltransferase (adenine-specific)
MSKNNETEILKIENNHIYNMDCLKGMKLIPDKSIDLIIADPPYYKVKGDFDFIWKNEQDYLKWIMKILKEFNRILKDDGTLMLWGGLGKGKTTLCRIAIAIEDNNLFYLQNWITQRNTRGIGTKTNYMSAREELLFLTKSENSYTFNVPYTEEKSKRKDLGANGKPRKNEFKRVSNVWNDIAEASQSSLERCEHPTVKALKLCNRIIETHSNEGQLVLVPFVGSGSEIISCKNNNRDFIGFELKSDYCNLANQRIKKFCKKDSSEEEEL